MSRMTLENIVVNFGATRALDGVSFSVEPGEIVALIGENGAGKSTLMKVLSGALKPNSGTMTLDGNRYLPHNTQEARSAGVAMIYQELSLAPALTAVENVFLGMEPNVGGILNRSEMRTRAQHALTELESDIALDVPCGRLSVSDQQLVEIARASALGCKVLILDEPTSSITRRDVERLFDLMRTLSSRGTSIIYISHFIEEVKEICTRFFVLRDGKSVGGGLTDEASAQDIVNMMVGRSLEDLYPRSEHPTSEALLAVDQLQSSTRLKSASFTLHRGEVCGVFGLVGSGRTELFRAIFGLDAVKSGQVRVGTYEGTTVSPANRWQQKIGMVSEDRKSEGLALGRTIAENLILSNPAPLEQHGVLLPSRVSACARDWIEKLSVRCRGGDQKIGELSGGNQQKIAIARLLHHDVDVLLLDEPTRGIDVGSKKQIYQLIDALARDGKAVLIVSSYLPELLGTCDRIAVMSKGVLSDFQPISDVTEQSIMLKATAV